MTSFLDYSKLLVPFLFFLSLGCADYGGPRKPMNTVTKKPETQSQNFLEPEVITYAQVRPIFVNACMMCHSEDLPPDFNNYESLIGYVRNGVMYDRVVKFKSLVPEGPYALLMTEDKFGLVARWIEGVEEKL